MAYSHSHDSTVTGLGLLPLVIGSGDLGREIEGPMAIVNLGVLVTSTALNVLVLSTLSLRYGGFEPTPDQATKRFDDTRLPRRVKAVHRWACCQCIPRN